MKKKLITAIILCITQMVGAQNLLTNGGFEQNNTDWTHLAGDGGAAAFTYNTTDFQEGSKSLQTVITALGTNAWSIQSIHANTTLSVSKKYILTFKAKANSSGKAVNVVIQNSTYFAQAITLTTTWSNYQVDYIATETSPQVKFQYPQTGTFLIDDVKLIEYVPPVASGLPLKTTAGNCGLNIGTCVDDIPLQNEAIYTTTIKEQFNMVVAENCMKMDAIKPTETGAYNFAAADRLVNFAVANNLAIRGHTIVWHSQVPTWITNKTWTKATLLDYLKTYITTVVGRYKGKIKEWDVANECIDDANNNALRNSIWFNVIGIEVLDSAYKWVHQVDPDALLYYNDYSAETMNSKSNAVYNMVSALKSRGAPIHGVGFQMHRNYDEGTSMNSTFITQIDQNVKRIGALGLSVAFTEIDLKIPTPFDATKYNTQAATYGNLMRVALNNPTIIETFMIWGFTDKYSWIPQFNSGYGDALIYDANYAKKPAYNELSIALDANCANCTKSTWYKDADKDGFGDAASTKTTCVQPIGYVSNASDLCPKDPNKSNPLNCGCNQPETCVTTGSLYNVTQPFQVFPNPSNQYFNIQTTEKFSYVIYDTHGNIVEEGWITPQENLIGKKLQVGIYQLKLSNTSTQHLQKIIVTT